MTSSSTSTTSTSSYSDDADASIQRSFAILSSMDLPFINSSNNNKRGRESSWNDHDIFCGYSTAKQWTQEEKDSLVEFANKYIIKGGDWMRGEGDEASEDGVMKNSDDDMKIGSAGKKRRIL